ncbi:pyridoxamine 5'-phosphate oxidase family protein [Kocuria soli]|nr:pyridoxamine 5'-phosphate oxidase family protein [Kocuria soli]
MTDFQDNARAALIEFVEQNPGGVLASHPQSGDFPEAAWIDLAVSATAGGGEPGEIVFGTDRRSRKALNIGARPEVSLVVVSGRGQEIQVEALARVLGGEDSARAGEAIAAAHPEGGGDPDYVCVVGLEPKWVRWVDMSTMPPTMQDFEV